MWVWLWLGCAGDATAPSSPAVEYVAGDLGGDGMLTLSVDCDGEVTTVRARHDKSTLTATFEGTWLRSVDGDVGPEAHTSVGQARGELVVDGALRSGELTGFHSWMDDDIPGALSFRASCGRTVTMK